MLSEFYRAFNERDPTTIERVWEHSPAVAVINPFNGVRRGWDLLWGLYQGALRAAPTERTEFYDYSLIESADLVVVIGQERGGSPAVEGERFAARTTNVLRREPDGSWKMVHHHVSFGDAKHLAAAERTFQALAKPSAPRRD